jgi:hypothetical protein
MLKFLVHHVFASVGHKQNKTVEGIADFSPIRLETGEVELFSGEGSALTANACAFAFLPFEIAVCGPATVPAFVSRMIDDG